MKNYIKLLVPTILLSTSIAFAQDEVDGNPVVRENTAEFEVVEMKLADDARIMRETKATYPVVFDEDDRYKLNQDRLVVAPRLETTYKLDADGDMDYDREITIRYTRPENVTYDFMLTEDGLNVWSKDMKEIHMIDEYENRTKVNRLSNKGKYHVIYTNGDEYEIEVIDMK